MDDNDDILQQARDDAVISAIRRKKELPLRTRDKMNELVDAFLEHLKADIHCMLCSRYTAANENLQFEEDDEYYGLDSDRDTEEEVEAVIRLFPRVLSTVFRTEWPNTYGDDYEHLKHPIQLLAFSRITPAYGCNAKAVSFIPIVVRLAIEFGSFEERERGGLLCEANSDTNALLDLMKSDEYTPFDHHNREHPEPVEDDTDVLRLRISMLELKLLKWRTRNNNDNNTLEYLQHLIDFRNNQIIDLDFLNVLKQLRHMGFLKKEDIQRYGLLNKLCCHSFLAKNRFQFLTKWDRNALIQPDINGSLPLHHVVQNTDIQGFKMVFDYGIRYHHKKKGINLLFRKNNLKKTSFQRACERFGYEEVMKIVDDTVTCYSATTPINIEEALLSAATDDNIHLDSVYFLLRRQPDVLVKLLSSHSSLTVSVVTSTNNDNNNNNNNRDSPSKKKGKRKRKRNSNGTYCCRQKD